jgi:hypothetical protein
MEHYLQYCDAVQYEEDIIKNDVEELAKLSQTNRLSNY